ncbi:MAG TPA: hypothetical protein VGO62_00855, partial [Myxococcota bacterium]
MNAIGEALAAAIVDLRRELKAPSAPVAVIVPSAANAALLRRALADVGPFFAVWFETPEQLLENLPLKDAAHAPRMEPAGFLRPTVGRVLRALVDGGVDPTVGVDDAVAA